MGPDSIPAPSPCLGAITLKGVSPEMNKFALLCSDIAKLWSKYSGLYLNGMKETILLALTATAVGCLIGFLCGILQTIPCAKTDNPVKKFFLGLLRVLIRVYVEVFRGTPMILQAVFVYYGVPYFFGKAHAFQSMWLAAFVVVSINTGAYMAESVRGGILSVDPGQTEGAKAIGMNHILTMVHVVLPQALRNIMPQIGNNLIINIKDTSVMFIIGFTEFFAEHKSIVGTTGAFFPSATIEMGGYLIMTVICSIILRKMEKKMEGSSNYELVKDDSLTPTAGTYNYPRRGSNYDERSKEAGGVRRASAPGAGIEGKR